MSRARTGLLIFALVFAVGPAPGEVGGCGDVIEETDALQFCIDVMTYNCVRCQGRGVIADEPACQSARTTICESAAWPIIPGSEPVEFCQPNIIQTDACIDQLSVVANVTVPQSEIEQCNVCPARAGTPPRNECDDLVRALEGAGFL